MYPESKSIFNVLFHLLMCFEHLEHHPAYNKCEKMVLAEAGVLESGTHCWEEQLQNDQFRKASKSTFLLHAREGHLKEDTVCAGGHGTSKTIKLGIGIWLCLNILVVIFIVFFFFGGIVLNIGHFLTEAALLSKQKSYKKLNTDTSHKSGPSSSCYNIIL